MIIATWNSNGPIQGNGKGDYVQEIPFDVMALQECENAPHGGKYNAISRRAGQGRGGNISLLSRFALQPLEDSPDCTVSAVVSSPTIHFLVVAVWIKPVIGDKSVYKYVRRLSPIYEWARSTAGTMPVVIAGDFNCNASFAKGRGAEFRRIVETWHADCGISSVWHRHNGASLGENEAPTWKSKLRSDTPEFMIDYIFAPGSWRTIEVGIGENCGSDHKPLVAQFELP